MFDCWDCMIKYQRCQRQNTGERFDEKSVMILNSEHLHHLKFNPYDISNRDNGPELSKIIPVTTITKFLQQVKEVWNNGC